MENTMLFSKLKKVEFFRGDSFQMVIDAPENAMKIAVLLRAGLRSCTPNTNTHRLWRITNYKID